MLRNTKSLVDKYPKSKKEEVWEHHEYKPNTNLKYIGITVLLLLLFGILLGATYGFWFLLNLLFE